MLGQCGLSVAVRIPSWFTEYHIYLLRLWKKFGPCLIHMHRLCSVVQTIRGRCVTPLSRVSGPRGLARANKPDVFEVEDISPPSTSLGLHRLPKVRPSFSQAACDLASESPPSLGVS